MTRINAGIPPKELTGKHLIAEHREIKRIPNVIKSGRYNLEGIPEEFCLGTGHVKFFYNKLLYLYKRYKELYEECKNRGYNVSDFSVAWEGLEKTDLWNDWAPSKEDAKIVQERINFKLSGERNL